MAARLASLGLFVSEAVAEGAGDDDDAGGGGARPRQDEVEKTGPRGAGGGGLCAPLPSPFPKVHAPGISRRVDDNSHIHPSNSSSSNPSADTGDTGAVQMSVSHSLVWKRPVAQTALVIDDGEFRRKKLKLNDLPVSSAKKTAIDGLLLTFKKNGEFDKFRKAIFSQFESSVSVAILCSTALLFSIIPHGNPQFTIRFLIHLYIF